MAVHLQVNHVNMLAATDGTVSVACHREQCVPYSTVPACRVLEAIEKRIQESSDEREAKRSFNVVDSSKQAEE